MFLPNKYFPFCEDPFSGSDCEEPGGSWPRGLLPEGDREGAGGSWPRGPPLQQEPKKGGYVYAHLCPVLSPGAVGPGGGASQPA